MRRTRHFFIAAVAAVAIAAGAAAASAGDTNQKAFERSWVGRRVVVKRPLYSLVYNEHGVRGTTRTGREGLTVITPFAGTYFQFNGRRRVDDVTEHDVQRIGEAVTLAYRKDKMLGEGWNQEIEPVMVARYDAGVELIVRAARVSRDAVRLDLALPADGPDEVATSVTVQWPSPLSKTFSERGNVEDLVQQFLAAVP